jgi:[ribosomal protein S5]-alanine N-acetyltransferase
VVVGNVGFVGPPDEAGLVELGCFIEPLHRRQDHARAALKILLEVARNHPNVKTVRVMARQDSLPARALIGQPGFQQAWEQRSAEDGGVQIISELNSS